MDIKERLDRHLRQLAPHVKERETGQLLSDAMIEIERLQKVMQQVLIDAQSQNVLPEWWTIMQETLTPNEKVRDAKRPAGLTG